MKSKRIISSIIILVILAALFCGATYYSGIKTEESFNKRIDTLKQSAWIEIISHKYDRRWFSATEELNIRLNPQWLNKIKSALPDNLYQTLQETIVLKTHIQHGPITSWRFRQAMSDTEFQFSAESQKLIKQIFSTNQAINLHHEINWNGSGKITFNIMPTDYQELSGIQINWRGLSGSITHNRDYSERQSLAKAPQLLIKLADKGSIQLDELAYQNTLQAKQPIDLTDNQLSIQKISFHWHPDIEEKLHLNHIINLLSDLQIGNLIAPSNQALAPHTIEVNKLALNTHISEDSEKWYHAEGQFQFKQLLYGREHYGPLNITIAAEHLHGDSLAALNKSLNTLNQQNLKSEEWQQKYLHILRNEGSGLFTHNPLIRIKQFSLNTPQGLVDLNGQLTFQQLKPDDLNNFSKIIHKTAAQINYRIAKPLVESLLQNQIHHLFATDSEKIDAKHLQDIQNTVQLMIDNSIRSMHNKGYINIDNNILSGTLSLSHNELKLNGKKINNLPDAVDSEDDFIYDESSDTPSTDDKE